MTNLYCPNGHEIAAENSGIRTYCKEWPKLPEKTQIGFVSFCPDCNKNGRYYFSQDLLPNVSQKEKAPCESDEINKTRKFLQDLETRQPKSYLDNMNIRLLKEKLNELNSQRPKKYASGI